jgi:hypothetical protein
MRMLYPGKKKVVGIRESVGIEECGRLDLPYFIEGFKTMKLQKSKIILPIISAVMCLVLNGFVTGQAEKGGEAESAGKSEDRLYTIRVRDISLEDAYEDHKVHVGESFFIADTEYSVKVERFVPDFAMNKKTKEVVSRSDELLNPALLLKVYDREYLIYETWILYRNLVPHAIHEPGYYFQFIAYENEKNGGKNSEGQPGEKN